MKLEDQKIHYLCRKQHLCPQNESNKQSFRLVISKCKSQLWKLSKTFLSLLYHTLLKVSESVVWLFIFHRSPSLQEYVFRVDPGTSLGLNSDSIVCYRMGEVIRSHTSEVPELLPCGYLVGDNIIKVHLKGRTAGYKKYNLFFFVKIHYESEKRCFRESACQSKTFCATIEQTMSSNILMPINLEFQWIFN